MARITRFGHEENRRASRAGSRTYADITLSHVYRVRSIVGGTQDVLPWKWAGGKIRPTLRAHMVSGHSFTSGFSLPFKIRTCLIQQESLGTWSQHELFLCKKCITKVCLPMFMLQTFHTHTSLRYPRSLNKQCMRSWKEREKSEWRLERVRGTAVHYSSIFGVC